MLTRISAFGDDDVTDIKLAVLEQQENWIKYINVYLCIYWKTKPV